MTTRRSTVRPRRPASVMVAPMLATTRPGEVNLSEWPAEGWTFEPKYDGVRAVAVVSGTTPRDVALFSRNGNDKASQFPEIAEALAAMALALAPLREPLILDGEIVALDADGRPAGFQKLQGRMHATRGVHEKRQAAPSAYVVFDCLTDGAAHTLDDTPLTHQPWTLRRRRLAALFAKAARAVRASRGALRLGETSSDGVAMEAAARREGWEGLIAKRIDAPYRAGQRAREWLKLKIEGRQEFVVGGWTDPEGSRAGFGALVVGTYDAEGKLRYAARVGTGFDHATLRTLRARLDRLATRTSPFAAVPPEVRGAHWVRPELVAEVKFTEWTDSGNLRHPSFQGLREDKDPRKVVREDVGRGDGGRHPERSAPAKQGRAVEGPPGSSRQGHLAAVRGGPSTARAPRASLRMTAAGRPQPMARAPLRLLTRLDEIEASPGGGGVLALPGGASLALTNLGRVVMAAKRWRDRGAAPAVTKGDLLRYYVQVAPAILPAIADRPLVLKRYHEGGEAFYQQHANAKPPAGVRTAFVADDPKPRFVGGDPAAPTGEALATLLYVVQLGAVSIDPWHSRLDASDTPDYTIIDLDPGPGVSFAQVVDCARWVGEELDRLELFAIPKTSGASGMHIVVPLPTGTPSDAARLLAELVASRVAEKHPTHATVVRSVGARPRGTIYVDYLQNIRGKTVASVYSARAVPGACVSTPLKWKEVVPGLDPRDLTIASVPPRLAEMGDLWAEGMRRGNTLDHLLAATEPTAPGGGRRVRRRSS